MGEIFGGRAENGKFNLLRRFNRNGGNRNGNINGRTFDLSVREHRDGAFVARFASVVMNQFVQRGAGRHRIEQQNQTDQQPPNG